MNKLIPAVWEVLIGTRAKEERSEKVTEEAVAEVSARDHVAWTKLVTAKRGKSGCIHSEDRSKGLGDG